jgi:hypothetical protein
LCRCNPYDLGTSTRNVRSRLLLSSNYKTRTLPSLIADG